MARLKEQYVNEIAPALNSKFGYKSVMQIPKLDKVVINVACGEAKDNEKILEAVMKDLGQITGQKAVVCRAKKSVANFKLRQGTPIGCKVTLRGERMYEFVDRFFNIALPRVRDFRGINGNGFDGRGNFACGIKEQIIFPEIDFEKVDAVRGMDICFVTTAKTDEEAKAFIADECGFDPEKIRILHEVNTYEVNKHRRLRKSGTFDRAPVYEATDWNYVRFDCACFMYELVNGELRFYCC